jgi:hypothetical protein
MLKIINGGFFYICLNIYPSEIVKVSWSHEAVYNGNTGGGGGDKAGSSFAKDQSPR